MVRRRRLGRGARGIAVVPRCAVEEGALLGAGARDGRAGADVEVLRGRVPRQMDVLRRMVVAVLHSSSRERRQPRFWPRISGTFFVTHEVEGDVVALEKRLQLLEQPRRRTVLGYRPHRICHSQPTKIFSGLCAELQA